MAVAVTGQPFHSLRAYMALKLRSHLVFRSEKMEIKMTVANKVNDWKSFKQ